MIISQPSPSWHLLMISARSEAALAALTGTIVHFLGGSPQVGLADVSFTLLAGRERLDLRKALVCRDAEDAVAVLRGQQPWRLITGPSQARSRKTILFLSERSTPALDLAPGLYASLPVFRQEVDHCLGLVGGQPADDLARTFLPERKAVCAIEATPGQACADAAAAFVFTCALAKQWLGWGLSNDAMIAEGVGECVAAHLTGCLSLEAALALAVARGRAARGDTRGALDDAAAAVRNAAPVPPRLPYHSGVTGTWITPQDIADAGYWSMLATAAGAAAPFRLTEDDGLALDIATGEVRDASQPSAMAEFDPDPAADGLHWMLSSLGRLVTGGATIDWKAHFADRAVRRVSLPTYPFEPRRHWFAFDKPADDAPAIAPPRPAAAAAGGGSEIERFLIETCQELLGVEPITLHDNVMKLGMDSMNVMQLSLRVNRQFGISIAPHHLFSEPDIASLTRKISAIRPDLTAAAPSRPATAPGATNAARLVRFVESLSDAEVKSMLAQLGVSRGHRNA